jgi:hypothetical protein
MFDEQHAALKAALAEADRLRAALAQAERERDAAAATERDAIIAALRYYEGQSDMPRTWHEAVQWAVRIIEERRAAPPPEEGSRE